MKFGDWVVQFGAKYQQYLDELAELGHQTARDVYLLADSLGNHDVLVSSEQDGNGGFTITASGEDATFLEFGAGVYTMVERPTVQANFDISPGSFSLENTQEFAKFGSWHWNHIKFEGLVPASGMQEACVQMEMHSPDIARRVFG